MGVKDCCPRVEDCPGVQYKHMYCRDVRHESDGRLKDVKGKVGLMAPLHVLLSTCSYFFTWKDQPHCQQIGPIAQEIQKVQGALPIVSRKGLHLIVSSTARLEVLWVSARFLVLSHSVQWVVILLLVLPHVLSSVQSVGTVVQVLSIAIPVAALVPLAIYVWDQIACNWQEAKNLKEDVAAAIGALQRRGIHFNN